MNTIFKTNRELVVTEAQPACDAVNRAISRLQRTCLLQDAEGFKAAREDVGRAMTDLQAAMDLLLAPPE